MSAWTHPPVRQSVMSVVAETADHVWQSSVHGQPSVNQTLQLHNHGCKTQQQCPRELKEHEVNKTEISFELMTFILF